METPTPQSHERETGKGQEQKLRRAQCRWLSGVGKKCPFSFIIKKPRLKLPCIAISPLSDWPKSTGLTTLTCRETRIPHSPAQDCSPSKAAQPQGGQFGKVGTPRASPLVLPLRLHGFPTKASGACGGHGQGHCTALLGKAWRWINAISQGQAAPTTAQHGRHFPAQRRGALCAPPCPLHA